MLFVSRYIERVGLNRSGLVIDTAHSELRGLSLTDGRTANRTRVGCDVAWKKPAAWASAALDYAAASRMAIARADQADDDRSSDCQKVLASGVVRASAWHLQAGA